ncbi:methionine synthase [Fodinibacter luteus]|uniref:Methionine synthase n=1 Tax=Fodinibacter luteus TaxID=552064 RepID=A0ABP8K4Q2_9MICO
MSGATVRATGIGSWPGTSVREAVRTVRDLLVDGEGVGLPHLPETPARGPGADIIGRAAGLLVDLPVDLQPSGWRLVDRPGRDAARTRALHREDLDELVEAYDGYTGSLKVQVAGPWTLAASLRLTRGERLVSDPGATADLVASLADGVAGYVRDVRRLVPGADVVLQVDEPSLIAVLEGSLPTSSGYGRVRSVDPQAVVRGLASVLAAHDGATVVHCCHPSAPLPLLRATGAGALSVDVTAATPARWESLAATLEAGTGLVAGCLATEGSGTDLPGGPGGPSGQGGQGGPSGPGGPGGQGGPGGPGADVRARALVLEGFERAGLGAGDLVDLVVSPTCGLAALTPEGARDVVRAALDTARRLAEEVPS